MSLVVVMFTMFGLSAHANSDYFSKMTAKSVGEGKVYVSYKNQADAPEYAAESSAESGADNQQSAPTHTYYLYAQPTGEAEFLGWFDNEGCTGDAVSTETLFKATIKATADSPASKVYYAKFTGRIFMCSKNHVYMNVGDEAAANDGMKVEGVTPTYISSNEAVATVDAEGNITPVAAGSAKITVSAQDFEDITYVVTVIDNSKAGITQIGNGDFEDWSSMTGSNHAPANWNSFETAEGSLASFSSAQQVQMVEDNRPGSNGLYCADIWSRSVLGVVAQGNLTTGCINAGAATASAKGNYNYSKTSDSKKSETLSKIPTAIRFWAKFVPAAANAQHPNAHMEAVVHDNCNYITYSDPSYESDEEKTHVIAKARYDFPTTNGEWVEITAPFEKTCYAANGQFHIIVNLATNADPGQGQAGDHLYVDDIELLYDTEYDEAPVVMTDAKYATFCAPFDVNVPYGMKAYTVQGVNEDTSLDMADVKDVIPANTPVILSGNSAKSLTAYGVAVPATTEGGMLIGVYSDTEAPVGSYVLQNIDGVVGMYQVAEGEQPIVKANHAYLIVQTYKAKAFYFSKKDADEATGINLTPALSESKEVIYNMAGQQVKKAQNGIYVINGKKVLK
jgi:hypothetical protein